MFRRSTKLTALLVAAAAVTSIAPASAAERLGTKEGTIEHAVAYANGVYAYEGYRTDDDDAGLYYNNGEKDTEADKDEDYDNYDLVKYGEKYGIVKDGPDKYLVDLSTGKIDDEETIGDKEDNARNKLKSKLNKTDRYDDVVTSANDITLTRILQNKFGEVWYKYEAGAFQGFVDATGNKYIDAANLANVYVYLPATNSTVKFKEYGDIEKKDDVKTKVTFVDTTAVDQDKDNIYAVTTVKVTTAASTVADDDIETKGTATQQYFFQKISKAQGDKKDDAYVPKNVSSYQIDDKSIFDNGDMNDAFNALKCADSDKNIVNITVKDGLIYATEEQLDDNNAVKKVKMWKLKFKKDKVDTVDGEKKVDTYVVKKDGDADNDAVAYSIDSNGTTWYLNKGTISKFDGTDKKDVYTCDRAMDRLDVYDENNLIAWEDGEDVYTTKGEGEKVTQEEAGVVEQPVEETTVKAGWDKNADGTWSYYVDGAKKTGWVNDNGTWYFIKADGIMATGWVQDGSWYYLQANGAMKTGWLNDNGTWYFLNNLGAMVTGWFQDADGSWYYLNASGAMAANTTVDGYVLGANGAWIK